MFDLDRQYNQRYNRPIIASIVDQTCTFQCVIPPGDLSNTIGVIMHRLVGMGLKGSQISSWSDMPSSTCLSLGLPQHSL